MTDSSANFSVCDLLDANELDGRVMRPELQHFGGLRSFCGPVETIKVFEDNVLIKAALGERGHGRILAVDGGGSKRCALMGDMLGDMAVANGWRGAVMYPR